MKRQPSLNKSLLMIMLSISVSTFAQDEIKLETTVIRGNKELPKILYVVPWKEIKQSKKENEQEFVLHSLFGDLFEPVQPSIQR